jgi:hypothetical protein
MFKYILLILILFILYKTFIILFTDHNIAKINDFFNNDKNIIDDTENNKKKNIKVTFNLDNNKYHYYNNNDFQETNYNRYGDVNLNHFNQSNNLINTDFKSINYNNLESKNIIDLYDDLTSDIRSYNSHIKNKKDDINYNINYLQTSILAPKLDEINNHNNILENDNYNIELYNCNLDQQNLINNYGGTRFDTYTITK